MQFLTHHAEALVWREGFLDHANGALALTAVWVATADPGEAADRFRRFVGRPISQENEVATIALERGAVRIATPEFLTRTLAVGPGPPLSYLAASEIQVASLPRLHDHLDAAGRPMQQFATGSPSRFHLRSAALSCFGNSRCDLSRVGELGQVLHCRSTIFAGERRCS